MKSSENYAVKEPKIAKVKIEKAVRTKNNKKIKITLRKVKSANGYQIQYSTKRNLLRNTQK